MIRQTRHLPNIRNISREEKIITKVTRQNEVGCGLFTHLEKTDKHSRIT